MTAAKKGCLRAKIAAVNPKIGAVNLFCINPSQLGYPSCKTRLTAVKKKVDRDPSLIGIGKRSNRVGKKSPAVKLDMRAGLKSVLYKPMYFAARCDTEQLTNYHVELIRATTRCSGDTTVISPGSGALSAQKCSWRQHIATELGPGAQLTGLAHFRHLNSRQCSPVQPAVQHSHDPGKFLLYSCVWLQRTEPSWKACTLK